MMEKKLMIRLDSIDTIREFAKYVVTFKSDINIIKGSVVYDAKSILCGMAGIKSG